MIMRIRLRECLVTILEQTREIKNVGAVLIVAAKLVKAWSLSRPYPNHRRLLQATGQDKKSGRNCLEV